MYRSSSLFDQFVRALVIARKDIKIYYSKGPVVIFGFLMPAFLFLSFSIGRNLSVEALMPGLLGMTLFFTSTAMTPIITPWETQARTLERLMSCPLAFGTIILGDILACFAFGLGITLPLLVACPILGVRVANLFILAFAMVLAAFCFSALGSIFGCPPTNLPSTANMIAASIRFPMTFISGIFVSLGEQSALSRMVSFISPLTYFTDIVRHMIQDRGYLPIFLDLLMLLLFTVAFVIVSIKLHSRTMPMRV